jgi:hypothetical protein
MKKGSDWKKFLLYQLPYIFYISFLLYWFYDTYAEDRTINYVAMGIAMVIFVQFVFQFRIVGASFGIIGIIFSFLFLFSILNDQQSILPPGNREGMIITLGIILAALSFLMGTILTVTNLMTKSNQKRNS